MNKLLFAVMYPNKEELGKALVCLPWRMKLRPMPLWR